MGSVRQCDAWETLTVDAYTVLGVSSTASDTDIRRAWRRHVKLTHPDVTGHRERFATVQLAYQCLTPPETRARYDLVRASAASTTTAAPSYTSPAAQPAPPSPAGRQYAGPAPVEVQKPTPRPLLWGRRAAMPAPLTVNGWAHSCLRAGVTVGLLSWLFAVGMFTTTTTQRSPFTIVDTFSMWIPGSVALLWLTYLTVMTIRRRPVLSWAGQSGAATVVMLGLVVALTQLPFTWFGWLLAGAGVVVFATNMMWLRHSSNPPVFHPNRHS